MKTCSRCFEDKPLDQYDRQVGGAGGLRSYCKACNLKQMQVWRERHPDRYKANSRLSNIKRKLGIHHTVYYSLLAEQNEGCARCSATEPGGRWSIFQVAHDADGGMQLVCTACKVIADKEPVDA